MAAAAMPQGAGADKKKDREPGEARIRNSEESKVWMRNQWRSWQEDKGLLGTADLPTDTSGLSDTAWFYEVRAADIDAGLLHKKQDKGVVRAYLSSVRCTMIEQGATQIP